MDLIDASLTIHMQYAIGTKCYPYCLVFSSTLYSDGNGIQSFYIIWNVKLVSVVQM